MKKLLIGLVIVLSLLVAFVACTDNNNQSNEQPSRDYGTATVYQPGDDVLIITSHYDAKIAEMRGALEDIVVKNGRGRVSTGTIYNENQKLEILINVEQEDESRPIMKTAKKYLDRIEKDSYFDARYVIYADSGQICIVFDENDYTNLQPVDFVMDIFMEKFINGKQYVAVPQGVIASGYIDLYAIQEELDIEYTKNEWLELEAAAKAKYGDVVGMEIVDAFRVYYSMISDKVVGWWANMYDPGIGGFYGTASGRDHLGYLPNIEGTGQILSHLSSSGMLDTLGGSVAKCLPDIMKYQIVYYYKSLQNPSNGYFYNPQLGVSGTSTYRLGRDQGRCTSWLSNFGSAPTYNHPNGAAGDGITADEYWDDLVERGLASEEDRPYVPTSLQDYENHITGKLNGGSVAEAVSAVLPVASTTVDASNFLDNHDNFAVWLEQWDIDRNPYSAVSNINATYNTIAPASEKLGPCTDASKPYYGKTLKEMVIEKLNAHINGRGLFGSYDVNSTDPYAGVKYANTNGLMKAIPIYNSWGIAYPEPLKAVEGCLLGIQSDEESKGNICETYNIWEALAGVITNVTKYGTVEQKNELLGYTDEFGNEVKGTLYVALGDFGPESIINTYNKQSRYQCEDGGFSHNISKGGTENGGVPIGIGLKEANVDANGFGMQSVINAMLNCFDLRSYQVALYTESDWMRFIDMVLNLEPVIKYSYDEMNGTSAIDKVFTFEDLSMPSQGLTVTNLVTGNSAAVVDVVGKDGDKGILRITKAVKGTNTNPVITTNANIKSVSANMVTYEIDVKVSNLTSKSAFEIKLATLKQYSAKEMPVLLSLTPTGLADGSPLQYRDYANGTSSPASPFDSGAKVGEWFTLKIEYYEGDNNTFRYRTYINNNLIYTSNSLYNQAMHAGGMAVPDASEIEKATFGINSDFQGIFEFDNISLVQGKGTLDDMGVGRPGSTEVPEEKPDGPAEVIPDLIPEGITTPAASDAITFDSIPAESVTKITSQDFLNTFFLTSTTTGGSVLYVDKQSYIDSNSGVIFRQTPTTKQDGATVAVFEADYFLSGYEQTEVIQFTISGKSTGNANSPFMILLKAAGKERGSKVEINNAYYDTSSGKSVNTSRVDTGAKVGEWFRFRIEYEVTKWSDGIPTGIKYRAYVNNKLVLEDTRISGANIIAGTAAVPSVPDLTQMNFSFNASTKGRFAVDNFSFRLLKTNDYTPGDLVIPDPTIGSGFEAPKDAVSFNENFSEMVAAGTLKVDVKESTANTFSVVSERGDKMLQLAKTDATKQEIFHHNITAEAGKYDYITYEAVLKYVPAADSQTENFEVSILTPDGAKILDTCINYGGADGALRIQAYKRTSAGTTSSDWKSPTKAVKEGDFFKIRIEYDLGATEDCTKIYINDELLISGSYYSGVMEGTAYTDAPHTSAGSAAVLNYTKFTGNTFIDYSYLNVEKKPEPPETTVSFDKDYSDFVTLVTNAAFADKNTWEVVNVDGNNVLLINKPEKDTRPNSYLSGISLTLGVTKEEANAKYAVLSFDITMFNATAVDSQITMNNQGKTGKYYSPILLQLPNTPEYRDQKLEIVIVYEVTAHGADGKPSAFKAVYYINGKVFKETTEIYKDATNVLNGSHAIPEVSQIDGFVIALNNSYLGDAYFDNLKLELVAEFEAPTTPDDHEHEFVEGKCECGAEDPNYVAPPVDNTVTFDKDYSDFVTLVTNAAFADQNTWEVVDVDGDKKLLVNKQGVDSPSSNGGTSITVAVTKKEEGAKIAVFEFDVIFIELSGTANQITINHKGYSGNKYSPFIEQIPGFAANVQYHITATYEVVAVDAAGVPTESKLVIYVNGDEKVTATTIHTAATNLIPNGGSVTVPTVDEIRSFTFSMNNKFLGKAHFDNMKVELLKEFSIGTDDHEHEFVEGKCECGAEDPNYVAPVVPEYESFDEMPAAIYVPVPASTSVAIVADPANSENKVLAIDTTFSTNTKAIRYNATGDINPNAEVAVFEGKVYVSTDSKLVLELMLLIKNKVDGKDRINFVYFNSGTVKPYVQQAQGAASNNGITLGKWASIRVEYRVKTGSDGALIPETTLYIDGNLIYVSEGLYGNAYYTDGVLDQSKIPAPKDVGIAQINISSSVSAGTYYFDDFKLSHVMEEDIHHHSFTEGKCDCGELDPNYVSPVISFDEMPETSLLLIKSGTPAEDPYAAEKNTWEIVTVGEDENKVLYIDKNSKGQLIGVPNNNGTPDDPSDDYTEDKKSTNYGVSGTLKVTGSVKNANTAVFEMKVLAKNVTGNSGIQIRMYGNGKTAAAEAPVMIYFGSGSNPANGTKYSYADYLNGGANTDNPSYNKKLDEAVIGEWFTIRVEYRVTETDASGKPTAIEYTTLINGKVVATSDAIYGKNICSGAVAIPKVSEIDRVIFAFNNDYQGDFYLDDISLRLLYIEPHEHEFVEGKCQCGAEDPSYVPPHEHEFVDGKCQCGAEDPNYVAPGDPEDDFSGVIDFTKDYSEYINMFVVDSFKEANTWEVVELDGDKKLLVNKTVKDTQASNSGVSLKLKVTEVEENATIAVVEFDISYADVTRFASQIQLAHAGKTAAKDSPFLYTLPTGNGETFHVVITYMPTAFDADGNVTEFKSTFRVNGGAVTITRAIYGANILSGSTKLPKLSDINYISIALNNDFLGKAYYDNMSFKLLASYDTGENDGAFLTFDEMPEESIFTIKSPGTTAEGIQGENTWEIVAVGEEGNKALKITKGANGKGIKVNDNGTPDDTSDDFEETVSINTSCNVTMAQYVTKREEGANVAIFEFDVLYSSVVVNDVIQITIGETKRSPILGVIRPMGLTEGSVIRNQSTGFDPVETTAKVGEWFHIRVEYRVTATDESGAPTACEVKYIVGDTESVTTTVYKELVAIKDIQLVNFAFNNSNLGEYYIDNVSLRLEYESAK